MASIRSLPKYIINVIEKWIRYKIKSSFGLCKLSINIFFGTKYFLIMASTISYGLSRQAIHTSNMFTVYNRNSKIALV
jgi:hypothetical protein